MEIFCIQIIFNFWYIITKEKCINKNERVCMCNYSNVVVETKDHATQCSKIGKIVQFQKVQKTLFASLKMAKKSIFDPEKV